MVFRCLMSLKVDYLICRKHFRIVLFCRKVEKCVKFVVYSNFLCLRFVIQFLKKAQHDIAQQPLALNSTSVVKQYLMHFTRNTKLFDIKFNIGILSISDSTVG